MVLYEKSPVVDKDWQDIINYTFDKYGETQVNKYTQGLPKCMNAMAKGEGHYKDMKVSRHLVRMKHCQNALYLWRYKG